MWFHQENNSIFYVDSDHESLNFDSDKMDTEVRTLKQELARTRDALKIATKRCRDLVRELDSRTTDHDTERCLRDQQLSRILRALLVLESRLKQEQKSIRQLLSEKDTVIRNQQLEIAKLRRYTKNYIKSKREKIRDPQNCENHENSSMQNNFNNDDRLTSTTDRDSRIVDTENFYDEVRESELANDIRRLKREIIDKLNDTRDSDDDSTTLNRRDDATNVDDRRSTIFGVRKTNSFAGSDVSKTSCASSGENTDGGSIVTTTTDESTPSMISTEGFCEGESTDGSPQSTLEKSSFKSAKSFEIGRCENSRNPENDVRSTRSIMDAMRNPNHDENDLFVNGCDGIVRAEPMKIYVEDTKITITRTDSKDDGMDCNFASDDDNEDVNEPIYVNSRNENNSRNSLDNGDSRNDDFTTVDVERDPSFDNNNEPSKPEQEEPIAEETSGNWYSDPDEDRISDEVFRHSSYRPNGNHNSVLECVNQILLRDMEEEETALTAPRKFKHRGRIVRFQPARLSDIESVGSEMERRNSDEMTIERNGENEETGVDFEVTGSEEDEFGMRLEREEVSRLGTDSRVGVTTPSMEPEEDDDTVVATPIVVIEPKIERIAAARRVSTSCLEIGSPRMRISNGSSSPTLRMERIEEKACLRMSSKGLTIAKNLDYEDIESLPEIVTPVSKTPPALPPKPTQFRNTLVLKKIPSPSFLIDETRRKHSHRNIAIEPSNECEIRVSSNRLNPKKNSSNVSSSRSLVFEERQTTEKNEKIDNFNTSISQKSLKTEITPTKTFENSKKSKIEKIAPIVTSMVRHFEEFKIGSENDERNVTRDRRRSKERRNNADYDDFDIRQNFEEFNLDDCDLSDDPDRPDGDGSDRTITNVNNSTTTEINDNNNVVENVSTNENGIYDNFLEATGLSNKSILTPSRLLSNHKSMLKPKDVKYKNKIKANAIMEKNGLQGLGGKQYNHVRHWTGPFV